MINHISIKRGKEILGKLDPVEPNSDDYKGELKTENGLVIRFTLELDGSTLDIALKNLFENLTKIVKDELHYRTEAAKDAYNVFIEDWVEDEDDACSFDTFLSRLVPQGIRLNSSGNIIIYYVDDDMFGGHAIECMYDKTGKKRFEADIVG